MNRQVRARPLFGTPATLLIASILLIPFGITFATNTEPFPAIVLPGGPSQVRVTDGEASFTTSVVVGYADGTAVELDTELFLKPVPKHFLFALANFDFGLAHIDDHVILVKKLQWRASLPRNEISDSEREELVRWYQERLDSLGVDTDRFSVQQIAVTVDALSGLEIRREIRSERVFDL